MSNHILVKFVISRSEDLIIFFFQTKHVIFNLKGILGNDIHNQCIYTLKVQFVEVDMHNSNCIFSDKVEDQAPFFFLLEQKEKYRQELKREINPPKRNFQMLETRFVVLIGLHPCIMARIL